MKAFLRQIRISPLKVNLVAKLVRGKSVAEALAILQFVPKRTSPVLYKVIESAAANAEHNFKQDKDKLMVKSIVVNEGTTMKRGMPVSRGRQHPILKRTSHIQVELGLIGATKLGTKAAKKVAATSFTTEELAATPVKKPTAKKAPVAKKAPTKEPKAAPAHDHVAHDHAHHDHTPAQH